MKHGGQNEFLYYIFLSQRAVTVYLRSKQLLLFAFALNMFSSVILKWHNQAKMKKKKFHFRFLVCPYVNMSEKIHCKCCIKVGPSSFDPLLLSKRAHQQVVPPGEWLLNYCYYRTVAGCIQSGAAPVVLPRKHETLNTVFFLRILFNSSFVPALDQVTLPVSDSPCYKGICML